MNRQDIKKSSDEFLENNPPSIKFMKGKLRYRILKISKFVIFTLTTVSISILAFVIIFNYRYKDLLNSKNNSTEEYNINENYYNAIENVKNSLVTVGGSKEALEKNQYSEGNITGIIIDDNGKIITNYSIIKDLKDIYVKLSFINSEPIKAEIVFINEDADIAVIRVNSEETLTPIKFADRNEIVEGKGILLISNSTSDEYIDNLIPGIITSSNRQLRENNKGYNFIEVNTPINEFNNGGIISNLNGELIGIASKKITDDMGVSGLYYSVDLSSLERIINYTSEIKDVLGVVEGELIRFDDSKEYGGLYVTKVKKDGSSYNSELRPTDIIIEIDGKKFNNISEVLNMLKNKENGDTVTCKVMRSGNVIDMGIVLSNIDK